MIIHPTRTNLLLHKERAQSVDNSIGILKARRQALIQEFLITARPFLQSRENIRNMYGSAIDKLSLSLGHEGKDIIESIALATEREISISVISRSIWGLKYKDIIMNVPMRRPPDQRGYDFTATTSHLDECVDLFERVAEAALEIAAFENKLKRLGDEIVRILRKIRVLEERVLPSLRLSIKTISSYIGERDRESTYRLKKFKALKQGTGKQF
jgi:V/A-type H+-transporting ATPase subunit D